jgi:hypothetical protein
LFRQTRLPHALVDIVALLKEYSIVALGAVLEVLDCEGGVKRKPGLRLSSRLFAPSELA